jgi:hypothetical protein
LLVCFNRFQFLCEGQPNGKGIALGPSENGLYPIPLNLLSLNNWKGFAAYVGVKPIDSVWHQRLEHPSPSIVQHLLKNQQFPLAGSFDKTRICEACQLDKSKQLPFGDST